MKTRNFKKETFIVNQTYSELMPRASPPPQGQDKKLPPYLSTIFFTVLALNRKATSIKTSKTLPKRKEAIHEYDRTKKEVQKQFTELQHYINKNPIQAQRNYEANLATINKPLPGLRSATHP